MEGVNNTYMCTKSLEMTDSHVSLTHKVICWGMMITKQKEG